MKRSEQINELAKALAAAQGEIPAAEKNAKGNRSRYADLAAVWGVLRDGLSKHELAVVQTLCDEPPVGSIGVETTLIHASGQWISSTCILPIGNKDAQGYGSAITYARRYSLSALVGVVADDDDDGEGACRRDNDREQPRRNAPEAAPQPAPQPERVDLAALARDLSEVRDSADFVACWNRHRIAEGHPDYEAVGNMFARKRTELSARAVAEAGAPPAFTPLDEVTAAFEAAETVTALTEAATRLNIPENHPEREAIYAAYRERQNRIEARNAECAA